MPFPFFYAYPRWSAVSNATREAVINSVRTNMADGCWCLHGPDGASLCSEPDCVVLRCEHCGYCSNRGDSLRKQAEMVRWLEAHGVNINIATMPRPAAYGMFLPYSVDRDSALVQLSILLHN